MPAAGVYSTIAFLNFGAEFQFRLIPAWRSVLLMQGFVRQFSMHGCAAVDIALGAACPRTMKVMSENAIRICGAAETADDRLEDG